jgi:coenzyme F420 biosynthesis associated uncharacterized protein
VAGPGTVRDGALGPVAWDVAEKVGVRLAGHEPLADSYLYQSLQPDFAELVAEAEELVEKETGLVSAAGPARARVTDRAGWVHANVASFERLLRPLTDKLAAGLEQQPSFLQSLPIDVNSIGRQVAGTQVGLLLGWMATRVLGQYDQLLIDDESAHDQDLVYFVGPNVLAMEKRYAFPPREFRLWLALHEVTHRVQFTGIPWMREYFLDLVSTTLGSMEPDPKKLLEALRRSADQVRRGHNPLDDGGLVAMLAGPEQYQAIQAVGGLMSLLEGHGDITMDRAGASLIPSADRFGRVLRERRNKRGPGRLLAVVIGLDAKIRQYEQGERFIESVEAVGGPELMARAWEGPRMLPTMAEIRDPNRWIDRVRSVTDQSI